MFEFKIEKNITAAEIGEKIAHADGEMQYNVLAALAMASEKFDWSMQCAYLSDEFDKFPSDMRRRVAVMLETLHSFIVKNDTLIFNNHPIVRKLAHLNPDDLDRLTHLLSEGRMCHDLVDALHRLEQDGLRLRVMKIESKTTYREVTLAIEDPRDQWKQEIKVVQYDDQRSRLHDEAALVLGMGTAAAQLRDARPCK